MSPTLRKLRLLALALVAALALAACSPADETADDPVDDDAAEPAPEPEPEPEPEEDVEEDPEPADGEPEDEPEEMDGDEEEVSDALPANTVRSLLTRLLQEHTFFAAAATNEALQGRNTDAALAALDQNSNELADTIVVVFPDADRDEFYGFWDSHIQMFVDYTVATANGDTEGQDAAVAELTEYSEALAVAFNGLLPSWPVEAATPAITEHVLTLKEVVDLQAEGDLDGAFAALRDATAHMDMLAGALTGAMVADTDTVTDASSDDLTDTQALLNAVLMEHVHLAGAATNGALNGNDAEFAAAAAALDANSNQWADIIAATFPEQDRDEFYGFWDSHIQMVVRYTQAVAAGDEAAADAEVDNLVEYSAALGVAFNSLIPELPNDVVEELVLDHILTLKDAIDAQAAGDWEAAFSNLRDAGNHMHMIADPVAETLLG